MRFADKTINRVGRPRLDADDHHPRQQLVIDGE